MDSVETELRKTMFGKSLAARTPQPNVQDVQNEAQTNDVIARLVDGCGGADRAVIRWHFYLRHGGLLALANYIESLPVLK